MRAGMNGPGRRERRAAVVKAWREVHGDWCPGYLKAPHTSSDLTADHVTPVAAGGSEDGELTVLCRGCNASRGSGKRASAQPVLIPALRSRDWLDPIAWNAPPMARPGGGSAP